MTYFLCTNGNNFYVIVVHFNGVTDQLTIDGVYISTEAKVSNYLLENRAGMEELPRPFTLDELQMVISQQLPPWLLSKGIKSFSQLVHLVECRR